MTGWRRSNVPPTQRRNFLSPFGNLRKESARRETNVFTMIPAKEENR